ncbi:MAG: DUF1127 domain-containing protein [Pseudomonadota bacterium]
MSTMNQTQNLPLGAITVHRLVSFFETARGQVADYYARQRTAAALRRLSNAQLDDIGLTPGDVEDIAIGRF